MFGRDYVNFFVLLLLEFGLSWHLYVMAMSRYNHLSRVLFYFLTGLNIPY